MLEISRQKISPQYYAPFPFSKDTLLVAPVIFTGYGMTVDADSFFYNDYEGLDIKNKWVMVLRGAPEIPEYMDYLEMNSDDRDKAMLARDNGAAGILFVSGFGFDEDDQLISVSGKTASVGIPVLHISRAIADTLLKSVGKTIKDTESAIATEKHTKTFGLSGIVNAQTDIDTVLATTSNWIGFIEGSDPVLKNEYIVIGAHYDHLGPGGPG